MVKLHFTNTSCMKPNYKIVTGILLIALSAINTISAQTWSTPVVAVNPNIGTGAQSGWYAKMVLVNEKPAMANYARNHLQYVRALDDAGTSWDTATTVDPAVFSGKYLSLLVVNGRPAISYYDETNGDLKFVRANDITGTTWGTPKIVDGIENVGQFTSMTIVNGNPAISYYDLTNGDLKYVRALDLDGDVWGPAIRLDFEDVVGQYNSLAVINGKPAIAYYDSTNQDLKFVSAADASGNSGTWGRIRLDSLGDVGQYTSLQEVNGEVAIAYYEVINSFFGIRGYLKYIGTFGNLWSVPRVLDGNGSNDVGSHACLQIVNGNPAISYYDAGVNNNLKYMRCNDATGMSWDAPINVDASGSDAGRYTSLQVVSGNPAICYYDQSKFDLHYVRSTDPTGATWGSPLDFDAIGVTGEYISLQVVDGKPAMSYFDGMANDYSENNYNLVYVRSEDSTGSRWGLRTIIDSIGDVGKYTSMKIVDGSPAISYVDGNGRVKYVRAIDAAGVAWGTPVIIDSFGPIAGHTSLQLVNGRPAIAYYVAKYSTVSLGAIEGHLKYARANDAAGIAWGTPVNLAGEFNGAATFTFSDVSLQVVNSNPAVAFFSFGPPGFSPPDYYLHYIRAADTSGAVWNTAINLDRGSIGGYTSLQVVKGKPAVSYTTNDYTIPGSNSQLKFKRAKDAEGSRWDTIQIFQVADGLANIVSPTSLEIINGNPAIAYYDYDQLVINAGRQKFVRASNDSGSTWDAPQTLVTTGGYKPFTSMVHTTFGVAIAYYDDNFNEQLPYFLKGFFQCPGFNTWTGNVSNAWEDPANWSCGVIPGSSSSVTIGAGAIVVINSNNIIKSLSLSPGASLQINNGFILNIVP